MDLSLLASPVLVSSVFVVVVVAAVVQAGLGMGMGMTAAPLLALIHPELVPAPTLFLGLTTALIGAWRERPAIHWDEVGVGAVGRVIGVMGGTALLAALADRHMFMLVFGIMIAAAALLSVSGWRLAFNRAMLLAMGVLSGVLGTVTSVGAPPMALIYQDRPAKEARPTLAAFFAIGCALSLAGLYLSGWAGPRDAVLAVLMLPPMALGTYIGRRFGAKFDRRFRPALIAVSAISSVILIARGLG